MKYLLISYLILLTSFLSFSQDNLVLDSLKTIENNQNKLDYLATVIPSQLYANPDYAIVYTKLYDSISKKTPTPLNTINALNFNGMINYVTHNYEQAIPFYLSAIKLLEKETPNKKLSRVYNNLAACYNIRDDFKNTEKYFLKAKGIASKINDQPWVANVNNNLSILYMNNEQFLKSEACLNDAISYYKTINDSISLGISYMNYGNSKIFSKKYNEAIPKYTNALNFIKIEQVPIVHAVANTGIGLALTNQKKFNNAFPYLEKGIKIAKDVKHDEQLMESYNAMANYYSQTKNYKNAYELSLESQKLKDSVISIEQDQNMAEALTKYEAEKKDAQLQLLKVEGEKNEQQKRLYLILAISGLIIISLLGYFGYENKKKSKLLATQKRMLENTLDEKNVLLKETHHRVKNSFQIVSSLLYLQSESVEDKEAKVAIKEAQNRVRSMVLIHQKLYNKEELVGINTKEYFNDLVNDIFESHQFQSESINYQVDTESVVLDIETITPIGLILNELIVNTLKHAFKNIDKSSKLWVKFEHKNDELILKVKDNGVGFEGNIKSTSFGITLMKALSKKLKATLNYNSKKNEGTEAILNIKKFTILS